MVRDHAVGDRVRSVRRHARRLGGRHDQRAQQVDVVVVVLALHHCGDALEAHAGVDGGARQVDALLLRHLLELHEDQIPDLDEPIALGIGAAGRTAGDLGPVVVEDLRAWPAGASVAHRPEIVGGRDADDLGFGEARDLVPKPRRLLVLGKHGDQQLVLGQAELLGDEVPRELDRDVLEVVAKGEVAEHLEEGVVARGVTDVLEVVVLAAGTHAFLRGRGARIGPFLEPREDVLELDHARVGEEQSRIVAWHQRARRHDLVAMALEVRKEGGANVVGGLHDGDLGLLCSRTKGGGARGAGKNAIRPDAVTSLFVIAGLDPAIHMPPGSSPGATKQKRVRLIGWRSGLRF